MQNWTCLRVKKFLKKAWVYLQGIRYNQFVDAIIQVCVLDHVKISLN